MTIRELLNKRLLFINIFIYIGHGLTVGGLLAGWITGKPPLLMLCVPGAFIILIGMLAAYDRLIRCPRCRSNLVSVPLRKRDSRAGMQAQTCPQCGVSLDESLI